MTSTSNEDFLKRTKAFFKNKIEAERDYLREMTGAPMPPLPVDPEEMSEFLSSEIDARNEALGDQA